VRRPPGRLRTELEAASLEHGGRVRTFHVHVPARLRADPMPVILALHGGAGTGVGMAAFTRLNTAVFVPMPSARIAIAKSRRDRLGGASSGTNFTACTA
jgi:hypothetical protein